MAMNAVASRGLSIAKIGLLYRQGTARLENAEMFTNVRTVGTVPWVPDGYLYDNKIEFSQGIKASGAYFLKNLA